MSSLQAIRPLLIALTAALAYWFLLHVSYKLIGGAYLWSTPAERPFPHGPVEVVAWFTLVDAVGALLAAVPVGIALARWGWGLGRAWVLAAGAVSAGFLVGRGFLEFAWSTQTATWVVGVLQFVSITVAPLIVVVLFASRPLTTRSSGR